MKEKSKNSKSKLLGMYEKMYLNRKYEERIYYLFLEGSVPGTVHQSTGQEACCVGVSLGIFYKKFFVEQ